MTPPWSAFGGRHPVNPGPDRNGWVIISICCCVLAAVLWGLLVLLGGVG